MVKLFVTYVDNIGPYLRIYGQLDRKHMEIVQSNIDSILTHVKHGEQIAIQIGTLCLARRFDKFSRARVMSVEGMDYVTVQFIDYGDEQTLHIQELRLTKLPKLLEKFPQQVTTFILSGIFCDWKPYQMQQISEEMCNKLFDFHVEMEINNNVFVRISYDRQDITEYLLTHKGLGIPIGLEKIKESFYHILDNATRAKSQLVHNNNIKENSRGMMPARGLHSEQQNNLQNVGYYPVVPMMATPTLVLPRPRISSNVSTPQSYNPTILGIQNQNYRMPYKVTESTIYSGKPQEKAQDLQSPPKRSVATFKSNTLMMGMNYDIYCCYVENGPCSFSVHLKSTEEDLNVMMAELENIPLENLTERPSLGMACIARFSEDAQLYRAVIMDIKPTSCQVAYVDYGNTEVVSFHDLYEIPASLLDHKIFAVRFALSGYKELEPIDDCIKSTFNELVLHRNLKLKVMPLEGPPLVQYCELYDGQVNILEALKIHKNRKLRYTSPEALHTNDVAVICYVESPKKFFVQKVNNIEAFEQMMDDLFLFCKKSRNSLNNLAKGTACAVKFENAWYRAEIIGQSGNRVSIRHVDFGNERKVDPNQLCALTEGLVQFPPQAIQCCLKGFEGAQTLSESATVQLEMLAESDDGDRRHFKCQIFKIEADGAILVNLIDESMRPELNLMKKLYKLSMPFNKYIGLEKEESGFDFNTIPKTVQPYKETQDTVLNSTTINDDENLYQQSSSDWDSGNVHQNPSSDWEGGSSASAETRDTRNSGENPRRQYQNNKPSRDNNRREQPYSTYKSNNLPPRFQKQQNDNRRFRDNKMDTSFEKSRNISYETSGKYSQSSRNSYHQVEAEANWSSPSDINTGIEKNSFDQLEIVQDWPSEVDTGTAKEEFVSFETCFSISQIIVPSSEESIICWWISPHQFYTHLKCRTTHFESMMKEMQTFYKNKSPTNSLLSVGSSVIARYREDNVLYRAKIVACNQSLRKYRVEFVDFGNQSTAGENDIYQVEKRFIDQPVMANLCAFEDIISNFDPNYITNKLEQYIKPGTTVICEYSKKENELYYVNIDINGRSLKDLMINDGLLSSLDTDMKLEMLTGQQIKAKIVSIQDLLNFKINIEGCTLDLQCCYNDIKFVKSNLHLSSEFKAYEGKFCIVDVLDVTGEKILMLQPHIALFTKEIVSSICDYPITYQSLSVKVIFVQTANKIYIHPVIVEDAVAQILDEMYNYYEASGEILSRLEVGVLCAANSNDGNWYRARIITLSNECIEVYYIDYGNTERIDSTDKLKVLEEPFYKSSALAVGLYLPVKSINDKEEAVINEIRSLTEGYELTLHILERYKNCWIVDVSSNGYSLLNVLEDNSLIQGRDIEYVKNLIDNEDASTMTHKITFQPYVAVFTKTDNIENNLGQSDQIASSDITITQEEYTKNKISAYLSHCDNPGRFFLHETEDFEELTKLQDNIQIVAGSLPPLMSIVTGASCIALYSVDDTWYRAKIIDNEIMAVQFIDYGNTDVITDSSYIKEMNEAFANIKPFAIPCSLALAPKGTIDWVDEANSVFNESYEKTVYFDYITKSEKKNFINLVIDGHNVSEKLIEDGLARQLEIVKSGETCFVSHINNLTDFYIQMEADADVLELIAGHLARYEDFPVIKDCAAGTICAALFPDDGEWYRAKILMNTAEGMEVLFIDYGNTSITTEARQISEEIAHLPFLTKKCSLKIPENILGWSDLAEARFCELSAMGQTVFVVKLIEPGEHAVIDLYVEEKNILEDLEPLCDKKPLIAMDPSTITEKERLSSMNELDLRNVTISHVNSPADFYVQFTTNSEQLNYITETLNGEQMFEKLEKPEKDQICSAVFPDDEALYRAKILSVTDEECTVIFIDFGNISSSTQLFNLPDNLNNIEPLATHCSLENSPLNFEFSSDIAYANFNTILESLYCETIQIEIVNQIVDPWIVRMFCKNLNINKELIKSLEEAEANKDANEISSESRNLETTEEIIETSEKLQKKQEVPANALDEQKLVSEEKIVLPTQTTQKEEETEKMTLALPMKTDPIKNDTENTESTTTTLPTQTDQIQNETANGKETTNKPLSQTDQEQKEIKRTKETSIEQASPTDQIQSETANETIVTLPAQSDQKQNEIENSEETIVVLSQIDQKQDECVSGKETIIALPVPSDQKQKKAESGGETTVVLSQADQLQDESGSGEETAIALSVPSDQEQNEVESGEETTIVLSQTDQKHHVSGSCEETAIALPLSSDQKQKDPESGAATNVVLSQTDQKQHEEHGEETTIALPVKSHEIQNEIEVEGDETEITDETIVLLSTQTDQKQDESESDEEITISLPAQSLQIQNETESAEEITQTDQKQAGSQSREAIVALPTQSNQKQDETESSEERTVEPAQSDQKQIETESVGETTVVVHTQSDQKQDEYKTAEVATVALHARKDNKRNDVGSGEETKIVVFTQSDKKQEEYENAKETIISPSAKNYQNQKETETMVVLSTQLDGKQNENESTEDTTVALSAQSDQQPNEIENAQGITVVLPMTSDQIQNETESAEETTVPLPAESEQKQSETKNGEETTEVLYVKSNPKLNESASAEETEAEKFRKSVLICHIISPKEFYIQSQSKSYTIKKITDLLEAAEVYETLTSPKLGSLCAAKSPDDGAYYRAKIVSLEGNSFEVILIDYGNKMNTSDVRVLPDELQIFEPTAEKCSLSEVPGIDFDDKATVETFNLLMESHFGEEFQIEEIKSSNRGIKTVKLFVQNIELGKELLNILKKKIKKPEVIKNIRDVFISHTISPNDFYMQLSDNIPTLDKISEKLRKAIEFPVLLNPRKSNICAAQFSNNGAFYRARILSVEEDGSEVLFIDFGNTSFSNDLRILPEDLRDLKSIAHHCALENLSDIDFWSQTAADSFCSLIAAHLNETFQAQIVEEFTDPWIIKLYKQNKNLGEELASTLKELSGQEETTEIWDTLKDNTANFTNEIVDGLVESAEIIDNLVENSMEEMNISDERDSSNVNTSTGSSNAYTLNEESQAYSSTEFGEKLWKGHRGLGVPLSGYNKNRAVSTSNIPQRNNFAGSNSSFLNIRNENTRSKSSDCLHVTTEK